MNFVKPIIQIVDVDSFRSSAENFFNTLCEKCGTSDPFSDDLVELERITMPETSLIHEACFYIAPELQKLSFKTASLKLLSTISTRLIYSDHLHVKNFGKQYDKIRCDESAVRSREIREKYKTAPTTGEYPMEYYYRSQPLIVGMNTSDPDFFNDNFSVFEKTTNFIIDEVYRCMGLFDVEPYVVKICLE